MARRALAGPVHVHWVLLAGLVLCVPGARAIEADDAEPIGWCSLEGGAPSEPGNDTVRVARSKEEAEKLLSAPPASLAEVDFSAFMVVVVPTTGNMGAKFDVEAVVTDGKTLTVRAVREMNADGNEGLGYSTLIVIVRKQDGEATAAWTDGSIAEMRGRRDCPEKGGHIATMDIGVCTRCGKDTSSGAAKLCLACARARTCCPFCLKRIAPDWPPK